MAVLPREVDAMSIWPWASLAGSAGFPREPGICPGTRLRGPHSCFPPSPQHPWERGETQLPWEINLLSEMHLPWEMHLRLPLELPLRGQGAANPSHAFLLPRLLVRFTPFGSSQCPFGPSSEQAGVPGGPMAGLLVQQNCGSCHGSREGPLEHKSGQNGQNRIERS